MKIKMALIITFAALNSFAASSVLMESVTSVGFAPPGMTGQFKTQILSNGTIQTVDNTGKIIKVAALKAVAVKSLISKMKAFKVGDLQADSDGPVCMDAPSSKVVVFRDGQEITVKTEIGCKTSQMYEAADMYYVMDSAAHMANTLTH